MLALYLKIAFRNMWKFKTQSLTGIFGLAFGLACFVPALYWLRYETSYDGFYPDADRIYRVYSFDKQAGKTNDMVSGILDRKLHDRFPAMQTSTVFFIDQNDCKTEGTPYVRLLTLFTDSAFLDVFPQTIVSGDAWHPLQVANNMILTETVAIRLFGDVEKAVGQSVKSTGLTQYDPPYTVTAVIKDPPANTNLSFEAILSHEQIKMHKTFVDESGKAIWNFASLQMYAKLPPYTDVGRLAGQLRDYPSRSLANENVEIRMLPIGDVRYRLKDEAPFTLNFIRLFVVAGMLLLFSALFNFLNLHLDLFRQRMRELCYLFGVASGLLFGGGCQSGLFRIAGDFDGDAAGIRAFCPLRSRSDAIGAPCRFCPFLAVKPVGCPAAGGKEDDRAIGLATCCRYLAIGCQYSIYCRCVGGDVANAFRQSQGSGLRSQWDCLFVRHTAFY